MLAPVTPLFKDFEKPVKDFNGNFVPTPGSFEIKVKDKFKNDNTFYCNPKATATEKKQSLAVEMGFKANCGGVVKVEANSGKNFLTESKWTASYVLPQKHNVSVTVQQRDNCKGADGRCMGCPVAYEIAHDGALPLPAAVNSLLFSKSFPRKISMHETLTNEKLDVGFGIAAAPHCFFGLGAKYQIKEKKCNWEIASKYHHPSLGMNIFCSTQRLEKMRFGVHLPMSQCCNCSFMQKHLPLVVGATAEVDPKKVSMSLVEAVCEVKCPKYPENTLKLKINKNMDVICSYVVRAAAGWTAAVSVDKDLRTGLSFTHG